MKRNILIFYSDACGYHCGYYTEMCKKPAEIFVEGRETLIECYLAERRNGILLFDSGKLDEGNHTLAVKVTGDKNKASSDCYINVDRVNFR